MLYKLLILCEMEPWMKVFMSFWRSSDGHDTEPGVPLSDVAKYAFAVHSPPSVEPKASRPPRICLMSFPVLFSMASSPSGLEPSYGKSPLLISPPAFTAIVTLSETFHPSLNDGIQVPNEPPDMLTLPQKRSLSSENSGFAVLKFMLFCA